MSQLSMQENETKISAETIELRFVGPGIEPQKIPLRAVTDALSAIQDLASWRDSFEQAKVPQDKGLTLVDVRKGSAVYDCIAGCPGEAAINFQRVGLFLNEPDGDSLSDQIGTVLAPLKALSQIAKLLKCTLAVYVPGLRAEPFFKIESGIYERITERAFVSGETTIIGEVVRAGGATDVRCLLRVPGRTKLLYCDVVDEKLARRLGQCLYEPIVATGTARWLNRTWRLVTFKIADFTQPELGNVDEAISEIRGAGLAYWDEVSDPESLIRGSHE